MIKEFERLQNDCSADLKLYSNKHCDIPFLPNFMIYTTTSLLHKNTLVHKITDESALTCIPLHPSEKINILLRDGLFSSLERVLLEKMEKVDFVEVNMLPALCKFSHFAQLLRPFFFVRRRKGLTLHSNLSTWNFTYLFSILQPPI